ncbi:MAG: NAD(P)/FAD-dependent oxidoreductase [Candidatus Pacebacteria bacterium]|nr:NAD(P)/FAD-dependent oxidoreductase [Candidatus Paceibacterota bacterium]
MENKGDKIYDCVIIGGGPAGMMAAISASKSSSNVLLLEKNDSLGKKLLLTGNGRCNLSHEVISHKDFVLKFGKNGDFLLSPFFIFGPEKTVEMFKGNGLDISIEDNGKMFPKDGSARAVLRVLSDMIKKGGVQILHDAEVEEFIIMDGRIEKVLISGGREISALKFIVATGGKSFPETGSNGKMLELLRSAGHSITSLYPGLSPIRLSEPAKNLSGVTLPDIGVEFLKKGKAFLKGRGSILFTHFGITGPIILDMSNELGPYIEQGKVSVVLDFFPDKNDEEFESYLESIIEINKNRAVKNLLGSLLPERVMSFVLDQLSIDQDKKSSQISRSERVMILKVLKGYESEISGLMGFDQAMVTRGGVSLKEIDAKTMRSKILSNLYLAGEVIDLTGISGGYNLQLCWTTGYVAGMLK